MKIEMITKDSYKIFVDKLYIKDVNLEEKEAIILSVKEIIQKLKSKLQLRGFYKVKVFPNKSVGLFIEIIQLEDLEFSNNLDLRVVVYFNEKIFFETEDYFLIQKYHNIMFLDDKFYCLIDDSFDDMLEIVEFGRLIYGNEVINLLNKGTVL